MVEAARAAGSTERDVRRLVVCFDGTWNTPDQGGESTNVVKLVRAIANRAGDGTSQIVFYDKGVGTAGRWDRLVGGLTGAGLEDNVVDGYRFLANNYADGDEIYLFGFSRGAFTARSLAGLIGAIGLFQPVSLGRTLIRALEIWRSRKLEDAERRSEVAALPGLERFDVVPIQCVGVFDTVGARGMPGKLWTSWSRRKYGFHNVQLGRHVRVALHALALDEKRRPFEPTLWCFRKGETALPLGQQVEQVWFPGVHSDVGGSYDDTRLSDVALQWMVCRVRDLCGLEFEDVYLDRLPAPDALGRGHENRTLLYLTSLARPLHRPIGERASETENGATAGDPIHERLHVSVLERFAAESLVHDSFEPELEVPVPYRPPKLAALIAKARAGDAIPVVDWHGRVIPPAQITWPKP